MAEQSLEERKEAPVDLDAEIRELLCVKKAFRDSDGNEYDRIADALKDYEVETRLLEDGIHVELRNRVNFRMYRQVFDHKALVEYRFESSWDISTMLTMVEAAIKGTEQEHVCLELAYVKWTPAAGPGHPGEAEDTVQVLSDGDVDDDSEDLSAMAVPTTRSHGAEHFVDSEAFSDYYTEGDALVLRLLEKSRFMARTYFLIIEEKPQRVYQRHGIVIERVQQKLELLAKLLIDDRQKTTDKTVRVDAIQGRSDRIEGEIARLSEASAAPCKDAAKVAEDLAKIKDDCDKAVALATRLESEVTRINNSLVTPSAIACLQSPTKNGEYRLWNETKYMATLATDWMEVIDNGERVEVKLAAVFRVEVTVTSTGNTNISCAIQVNDNVMAQTRAVMQDAGHCQSLSVCWVQLLNIGDKIRIHAPFSVDELISNTLIVRML